ncbi:MAG TPA: hypothetical protein VGT06_03160 [Candidatus Methylomirabilis sp.]|nr:hypothetical protein [Candidatus Methylomirabilis sp.]
MTNGVSFGPEETVHSTTLSLANFSLSFGGAGRFITWQESSLSTFTSSVRFRLGVSTPETLRSGDVFAMNPASPSGGADGTERLFASWQENGTAGAEIKLAHTGGSGSGEPANAWVEMTPNTLNAKTMYQGEGVFTLRIRVPGVGPGAFDVKNLNLTINGQSLVPIRGSVGDADGDGTAELELKFRRSDLLNVFGGATLTAAQRDGSYTVAGNTSAGCFSGGSSVRILR